MRVEPNKKLVTKHISAYKNIIADLRDEIDKLKVQLQADIANKVNPLVTKHAQMYPRKESDVSEPEHCECATRQKDEVQKQMMLEEIHLAYEEIL